MKEIIKMLYEMKYVIMTTFHNRHRFAQFAAVCLCMCVVYLMIVPNKVPRR